MSSVTPDIESQQALCTIKSNLLRLKWLAAAMRFELAVARHDRALKAGFNPDQPRVPAGDPGGGQWASEGGNQRRVRLAGDIPTGDTPPLQRIHPDSTYESDRRAANSLEYWRRQPTEKIIDSLKPGEKEALRTYPDGRIANGNTRTKVLQERGHDINSLPREIYTPKAGPRGGGSFGGGRLPGGGGGFPRSLLPWQ